MYYKILKQKCKNINKKGTVVSEGVLDKINKISEWERVESPIDINTLEEKEIDSLNTAEYQQDTMLNKQGGVLIPGNTINLDGQIISFPDQNSIFLVISETGGIVNPKVVNRIIEEKIDPEYKILSSPDPIDVVWEALTPKDEWPAEFDTSYNIGYCTHRIWIDRFVKGREQKTGMVTTPEGKCSMGVKVKAIVSYGAVFEAIFTDWEVWINSNDFDISMDFDKENVEDCIREVIKWFITNYKRLVPVVSEKGN